MDVTDEISDQRVCFKRPRQKLIAPFTLKEEVSQKLEPVSIEAFCGIVGQPNSGRKHLGDRFARMNENVIEEIKKVELYYEGKLKIVLQGRPVEAVVKAYIIPPPFTSEEVSQYFQMPHQICCLLFAFDVTKHDSFCAVQNCIKDMKRLLPVDYFLVGTKCDLREPVQKSSEVEKNTARMQALQLGAKHYFECSAKYNTNVKSIMEAIVKCEWDRQYA